MTDPPTGGAQPSRYPGDPDNPGAAFQARGAKVVVRRALRRSRELIGDDPVFLPIVLRLTPLGTSRRITDRTEIVIEGFPRSGNTFATFALHEAEGREVDVSSHVHVPAQVKVAVKMGKPTLVVVRDPMGTLTSLLTAAPHVRFDAAIREYIHHHRELVPFRDGFVVGTFEKTTTDFSAVIDAVNQRFGTTFSTFTQTPETVDRVFDRIDAHHRRTYGDQASERVVPRPSRARHAEKVWLADQLQSRRYAGLMADARDIYDELADGA